MPSYLAYSPDAVKRLPAAVFRILCQHGYNIVMDRDHHNRFDPPPLSVLEKIETCSHFLLLLTPASICYGFNYGENFLRHQLDHARSKGIKIILLLGYEQRLSDIKQWRWRVPILDECPLIEIDGLEQLPQQLQAFITPDQPIADNSCGKMPSKMQLKAESILDAGLTEQYDSLLYNRRSRSVDYFVEALSIDPEYAEAYFQRAKVLCWSIRRRPVIAVIVEEDYDAAIQLNAQEARYYNERAWFLEDQRRYREALADCSDAIRYDPQESRYYDHRASLFIKLSLYDRALADYDTAIKSRPDRGDLFRHRAVIYMRKKDYRSALMDMDKAIELDASYHDYIQRGFIHVDLGEIQKAQCDWRKAVQVSRYPASAFMQIARVHDYRQEYMQALIAVYHALRLSPTEALVRFRDKLLYRLEAP